MSRRTTLGGLTSSGANTLAGSRGTGRASLGPARVTNEGGFPTKSRMSLGGALLSSSNENRRLSSSQPAQSRLFIDFYYCVPIVNNGYLLGSPV
jgi:hypothetical protein